MKAGVKRDLIFVVVLFVGIAFWMGLGFMLAPSAPPPTEGGGLETNHAHNIRNMFIGQWIQKGMVGGITLVLLYSGLRGYLTLSAKKADAKAVVEKLEDNYLSGKTVAIIVGIFAAILAIIVICIILSND